jgi:amino acid adenylation domain-containing protein/FkbM family methyltransferase
MFDVKETPACLHDLVRAQARRTPGAAAVVYEGEKVSYAELDERAEALAATLRQAGAGPDVRIGIVTERSLQLVVDILAVLKAGAAYVPIDPAFPAARIAMILQDAGARILLAAGAVTGRHSPPAASAAAGPEALAYVIYTSGSTGRPKGVCVEHRNIVNYVKGVSRELRLRAGMRHALVSTVAADLGNTVLFPALATGGCLHVMARNRTEDPELFADYVSRQGIDVLKITPSHLHAVQGAPRPARALPRERLVLGGEPLPLARAAELRALAPHCEIYNHYGPTETTVGALMYRVPETLPQTRSGTVPIGAPLPGARVHVIDASGMPCARGAQGELLIGGAGVARGYLGREDLTREKFVADPVGGPGRVYRTGDLVRLLPDGNIEFCGRSDDQIKLGGHRVEPAEVEHVLREHGGVRQALVRARNEGDNAQLVAYVVPRRLEQPLWNHSSVHVLPDGTPVAHLNRNETEYIFEEIFVRRAYCRHGISIADGDCILDAGANVGLFTVFASRMAKDLTILAFEPNPPAFERLQANAKAWGGRVLCLPYGLSSDEKWADFTFFEGMSLLSGVYADPAKESRVVETYVLNGNGAHRMDAGWNAEVAQIVEERMRASTARVKLRTLSQVIAEHRLERIDLLKINVEKSELDVLRGVCAADWPKVRQLVIEVDRRSDVEPITLLLRAQGFEVCIEQDPLLQKTDLCYVYALRPGPRLRGTPAATDLVLSPGSLRKHVAEHLPRHMVPSAFVLMDKLPLTANGKVDRDALPAPELPAQRSDPLPPRTATETALAAIWSELLQVEHIGMQDDFFDLGGQSLLAIRMVARIREAFGVEVKVRNLFERPTLHGLCEVIDGMVWAQNNSRGASGGANDREQLAL